MEVNMKALILYDSFGGNTEKVANSIYNALNVDLKHLDIVKVNNNLTIDFYDYELVFIGSPVIDWLPTKTMIDFLKTKLSDYNTKGLIKPSAPIIPGKFGVCFGTYAGPHIGKREALPMTMWLRSFLEHIGYIVLDEWHVTGTFKNRDDLNLNGRLGDIRNRPDENDLSIVTNRTMGIFASLEAWH